MIGLAVNRIKGISFLMPLFISKKENNMKHPEQVYLDTLNDILTTGEHRPDRTGVGTISKFAPQMRFDLTQGFPALTTKKLAWKAVVSELLWFIEGSGDEFRLREILHGERYTEKRTIWSDNLEADYWVNRRVARHKGDLGRIYGVQWRSWRKPVIGLRTVSLQTIDQLSDVIKGIKADPYGRRHIVSAWNPGELDMMALPPCHIMFQFYVSTDKKLSCHMYQRSADFPLGVPFNIASYALLTHMVAQVCDLTVGELIISFGDAHIYENQVKGVKEQLKRTPGIIPNLMLNPEIKDIGKFTMDDITLENYEPQAAIEFPFAV
jgi:thymidylate synthase